MMDAMKAIHRVPISACLTPPPTLLSGVAPLSWVHHWAEGLRSVPAPSPPGTFTTVVVLRAAGSRVTDSLVELRNSPTAG